MDLQANQQNKLVKAYKVKKRLRSLVPKHNASTKKKKNICRKLLLTCLKSTIAFSIIITVFVVVKNTNFLDDLRKLSVNQYQIYLHGRNNYCNEHFDFTNITNALNKQVYGQDHVIEQIVLSFKQHENFTALSLIGSQGVGKTLTLNIIQTNFQWHLNIQQLIWSPIESKQNQLKRLLKLLDNLTTCGQNALLIDGIAVADLIIIAEFNEILVNFCRKHHIKVIAFYVIQSTEMNKNDTDNQLLQAENVKPIHFRAFNYTNLHNCILIESNRLQLNLTQMQIDTILNNIDVERTGCKTVSAKVSRFTQLENSNREQGRADANEL